jgi:type I restriction enzyme M protein
MSDDRFSQYGRLAPGSKADFAFIQHMIAHLDDNGVMAMVAPHGVLFRGGAEGHIRRYLVEDRNYLDAVIGLPANIFYGTSIPTCILVFKTCREHPDNILFIDASRDFEKAGNQNMLTDEHVDKIVEAYAARQNMDRYARVAPLAQVAENDYNLNIPRYVDTFEKEDKINLIEIAASLNNQIVELELIQNRIKVFCEELGIPKPLGYNLPLLNEYKKGVIQQIFCREIRFRPDEGEEFGEWEQKMLGEVVTFKYGKDHKLIRDFDGNFPILGTGGTMGNSNEFLYDKPSVLIGRKGTIDRPVFMDTPFWTVDTLFYTEIKPDIYPKWLFYAFQTINWYLYNEASGVPSLSVSTISKIEIDVPSKAEQQKIASFLSALDEKIGQVGQQLENAKGWKKGLLQGIFV